MQKLKEKKILGTVPKKLQLVETFWDCPEFSKKQNNQKGITLIALIITIIVMLILVGVTINVALNGGLFTKAETATRETEEKAILEEMLAMMVIDNNGKIKPDEIIANMKTKYEIDDSNKPNIAITGKLGTYNYIVSETEIKIGSKNIDYRSELEKYFFNEDGTGKTGLLTQDEDTGAITFEDDPNTIAKASTSILLMNFGETYITVEYKGADYRIDVENMDSINTLAAITGEDNEKVTKLETIYEGNDDDTKIKQYFLGYSGTGKYFYNLLNIELSVDGPVLNDNDIIENASEAITFVDGDESGAILQYNGSYYVIEIDSNMIINNAYKREETGYKVYTNTAGNGIYLHFIKISETEGIFVMDVQGNPTVYKKVIEPCNNIDYIEGYENVPVKNESNISYSLLAKNGPLGNCVYNQEQDKWFYITAVTGGNIVNCFEITANELTLNYTMSEEQINSYIELAN